jgi:dihydroorotate dehydrogenase (fumarate)
MDLKTNYMGLELKNPLVVSSSPLSMDVDNLRAFESHGASAVVLRSLYEEQIIGEMEGKLDQEDMYFWYPEAAEHVRKISKGQILRPYLSYVEKAKNEVSIPIIASINCYRSGSWVAFARK